ncbi:hypothetical protein Val02_66520 [Virgisporangium aliadipatigenens]|uniref:Uncharacterized protein n=1 Tax=Virgisporangium aliadipatigenens TaxID=741659 RepID=A0A8J4DTX8_9ACTN|nr:hypothetical protein [Virgisporangium aliadipatigenens]GIJ49766.1 hypothetical protein Val02_66520 [Virgisporangium aliadipatigenens]
MTPDPRDFGNPPVQLLFCRQCRRAVNTYAGMTGVTYLHTIELRGGTADHRPDPAPVTEIADPLIECDFCSASDAAWIYRCADQHTDIRTVTTRVVRLGDYRDRHDAARARRVETAPGLTQAWGEQWAACAGCGQLVEERDLYGLIRRVVEAMPPKLTRGNRLLRVRGTLHTTYSAVFDTLIPGRGRIEPGHPLGVWPSGSDGTR